VAGGTRDLGQALGTDDDERHDADHEQFRKTDVKHGGSEE